MDPIVEIKALKIENRALKSRLREVEIRVGINPDASFDERVKAEAKRIYAEYGSRLYQRRKAKRGGTAA